MLVEGTFCVEKSSKEHLGQTLRAGCGEYIWGVVTRLT